MDNVKSDYSPDNSYEIFKNHAIKCSVICLIVIISIGVGIYSAINNSQNLFGVNLHVFENITTTPLVLANATDGLVGDGDIKIGVSSCIAEGDRITVTLYGENSSSKNWAVTGNTFVLTSFNTAAAETRYHYYSQDWTAVDVLAHRDFSYDMTFEIDGMADKLEKGYIFTLTAFRNESQSTTEIVLNNIEQA